MIETPETGGDEALSWLKSNFMFVNLDKFKAIISRKDKTDTKDLLIRTGKELIKSKEHVIQLGVNLDHKLSYNLYISEQIKKVSAMLNAIKRMGYFLSKSQKISLCYSHVISYFNYCSLVWHFGSLVNIHATEKLHERAITRSMVTA